jgi:PAS domain S-box-containing protein
MESKLNAFDDRLKFSPQLFASMTEGFLLQNQEGKITYFNDATLKILGLTSSELLGVTSVDPMWRTIHEDGSPFPGTEHPASIALQTGVAVEATTMGIYRKNGDLRWISINASPIYSDTSDQKIKPANEAPSGVVVTFKDITDLKETEKALRKVSERFELVQSTLQFGVWDWDYVNNKLEWDEFQYKLYGIPKEKFFGAYEAFASTLQGDEGARVQAELQACFDAQKDFKSTFHTINQSTGEKTIIGAAAKCFYDEAGKIQRLVGANWDITEQNRNEEKLIQASKMSSLGEMAGGIAHEINNPLTIIQGMAFILGKLAESDSPDKNKKIAELSDRIGVTVQRIAKIIQALRVFSRNSDEDPSEVVSVNKIVLNTLELCQERFKIHNIELRLNPISEGSIRGHGAGLSQCLLNLLNNAHDAVFGSENPWIEVKTEINKQQICISVTDSGKGISKTIADRMFAPFFTTKPIGAGTGLGLSITKGIIEKHGGTIFLDQESPNTCFKIQLPLFIDPQEAADAIKSK